jgi:uncharacterized Fe-S center protein
MCFEQGLILESDSDEAASSDRECDFDKDMVAVYDNSIVTGSRNEVGSSYNQYLSALTNDCKCSSWHDCPVNTHLFLVLLMENDVRTY